MPLLVHLSERMERLRGRLLLFAPIFLGIGIGCYFSLRVEPNALAWALILLAVVLLLWLGLRIGRGGLAGFSLPFWALALVLTGLLVAGVRTAYVAGPVLGFRYYGPVEGRVVAIDRSQSDALRLTLDNIRLERVRPDELPRRVRVSLHGDGQEMDPMPGMRIAVTAFLSAPEGPVEPGGFDFRRMAWFRGIGAVGYARTPAMVLEPPDRALPMHRLRRAISTAVQVDIPGEAGAFAAAITTGDRSGMGRETLEALRGSNLAHLLAISGLHMGLLVGFVYGTLRLALALVPGFGAAVDVRRIAAVVALIAGAFYLGLSGGAVSTSRAFIMVAVMLGGVIAGRRALTLRAVAVAALILLVFQPETLVEAGFQMSFAATTALVAVFGALRSFESQKVPRWLRPVFAVVLSSFVAGLATAPFSAAIFNRVAHYGLLANVVSVPVMGALIMPLAVLAALLWPLGLSWVALAVMRFPIEWILWVARKVSALDGATSMVVAPQGFVLPLITLGGLAMVLLRGGGRVTGGIAVVVALMFWSQASRPDVLITNSGGLIGVLGDGGRGINKERGESFAAESWLANDGDRADQITASARDTFAGTKGNLMVDLPGLQLVQLSGRGALDRVAAACATADVVILATKGEGQAGCRILTQADLARTGSLAIHLVPEGYKIVTTAEVSGDRPWTRQGRDKRRAPYDFAAWATQADQ